MKKNSILCISLLTIIFFSGKNALAHSGSYSGSFHNYQYGFTTNIHQHFASFQARTGTNRASMWVNNGKPGVSVTTTNGTSATARKVGDPGTWHIHTCGSQQFEWR